MHRNIDSYEAEHARSSWYVVLRPSRGHTPALDMTFHVYVAVTMLAYNKYGQDLELTHVRVAFVTVVCIVATCIFLIKQAIQQSKEAQPVEFEVKEPGK